jgi:hypothetical protein
VAKVSSKEAFAALEERVRHCPPAACQPKGEEPFGPLVRFMAFDQVSLFLYPPGWRRHSVADTVMKHYSGEPVRIVSAVRAEGSEGAVVRFDDLRRWLEVKGFETVNADPRHGYFCSDPVESALGRRAAEIVISTGTEADEVTSLYCRFQLNRDALLRAERWEAFMQELCEKFDLRIGVSDTESVGPEEFMAVLRRDESWCYFARHFGWPEASE